MAPLGQVSLRLEDSHVGVFQGGQTDSMPESPWIIMSRTSCGVLATRAILRDAPDSTRARTHSAPVRVLPKPRPARSSQMRQGSSDGIWLSLAQRGQWNLTLDATCSVRSDSIWSNTSCLCRSEILLSFRMIESRIRTGFRLFST